MKCGVAIQMADLFAVMVARQEAQQRVAFNQRDHLSAVRLESVVQPQHCDFAGLHLCSNQTHVALPIRDIAVVGKAE